MLCSVWVQASEPDRPVTVWHGKNCCFFSGHAQPCQPSQQVASGEYLVQSSGQPVSVSCCRCTTTVCLFCFQCLCISPTYELALQIGQVIEQMGKFCPDVKLAYGIRGNRSKNVAIIVVITNGISGYISGASAQLHCCVNFFCSGAGCQAAGADCHWNTWHNPRLVQQVQTHRP